MISVWRLKAKAIEKLLRYAIDLSNEVLNIDFGQGAAKISEVKIGGQKNVCRSPRLEPERPGLAELADIFFKLNRTPL